MSFRQYRDPCSFSYHLSGFRVILSILRLFSLFGFHRVLIMQEIQLAELICFFMSFETCCFSLHSSVLVIPQYAQNSQKVTRPIYETFCCVFRFFTISSSWYFVNSVLL